MVLYSHRGDNPINYLEAIKMKKGNVYENKMGSVLKITAIKNDMVYVTYNGKKKSPISKNDFQVMIEKGYIWEV